MTLEQSVHAQRLRVLREAARSGNVSATCRRHGLSRTQFYALRRRYLEYGPDGVAPKRRGTRRGRPSRLSVLMERRVMALAVAWPTRGPQWVSDELTRDGLRVAPVTIWRLLHRHGLGTRAQRLAVVEYHSAATVGLVTERTTRLRRRHGRHVNARRPGDLLSLDTFYVGKLKGVGKVWQITACDCATSYAWAQLVRGEVTATAVVAFVRDAVMPAYERAGWPLQRVLTDNGTEFKAAFTTGCAALGIRHTHTKPRHAWTNGFVERLQGTILHEHWRVAFRRQYFTGCVALQRSLDRFLQYYNGQRSHHGYRLRGRTPASVFHGAVAA